MGLMGLTVILAAGCGRRLDESVLGDEVRLLFRDFDDAPETLPATLGRIDVLMDSDLTLDAKRKRPRSFETEQLTAEFRGDLELPEIDDSLEQLGIGIAAMSRHDLQSNLEAQVQEDQVCINANAVKCHARIGITDVECFLDGSCDVYRTLNDIRLETTVVDFWLTDVPVDFRRVELEDGRSAAIARTWLPEVALSDRERSEWRQRFGVDVFVEDATDPTTTRRLYATWLGGNVNGMGNRSTAQVIFNGMDQGFENPDDWLDGDECKIDTSDCEWP